MQALRVKKLVSLHSDGAGGGAAGLGAGAAGGAATGSGDLGAAGTSSAAAALALRRAAAAGTEDPLWQRSFHDHALRSNESVIDVGRYVLANPVRAKLAPHWSEWRWRGGEWLAAFEAELPWCG